MAGFSLSNATIQPQTAANLAAGLDNPGGVSLTWDDYTTPDDISYAEIWRADTNDVSTATMIGATEDLRYFDGSAAEGVTHYYWITLVGTGGTRGAYNTGAAAGTPGTRPPTFKGVYKTADETKNSDATTAADADLAIALEAGAKYLFRAWVPYYTVAAADFKYKLALPTGATGRVTRKTLAPAASAFVLTLGTDLTTDTSVTAGSDGEGLVELEGYVDNPTNAGDLAFAWAQDTSDAGDTILREGAALEIKKVA